MLHALNFSIPDDSFLLSGINSTTLMGDLKLQNPIKKIRESITKSNGHTDSINESINYEEFKKIWFPDVNAHVFISHSHVDKAKEGANKQVISSQADSLIKISRIWADFFPANTSNQPI